MALLGAYSVLNIKKFYTIIFLIFSVLIFGHLFSYHIDNNYFSGDANLKFFKFNKHYSEVAREASIRCSNCVYVSDVLVGLQNMIQRYYDYNNIVGFCNYGKNDCIRSVKETKDGNIVYIIRDQYILNDLKEKNRSLKFDKYVINNIFGEEEISTYVASYYE